MRENTDNSGQATVNIGGKLYDAHTGMPITTPVHAPQKPSAERKHTPAGHVHASMQRSKTLHRSSAKPKRSMDMVAPRVNTEKSAHVTKFSPAHSTKNTATPVQSSPHQDKPVQKHQLVEKASAKRAAHIASAHAPTKPTPKTNQQIKEEAIEQALKKEKRTKPIKKSVFQRHPRMFSIVTGCAVLMLLVGWLTYTSFPNISVRIAASQAGISATHPGYKPDGYRLQTPVRSENNQVVLRFHSTTNDSSFTITQVRSNWDSQAVRDYVDSVSDGQFLTTQDRGITIYTYSGNAAWVNKGILYEIESDAPLGGEQIRLIAASF